MPDAVLGGNDQMGIAALLWLQGKGLSVPEEIKVTGFNGFEFARFAVPKLTTVRSAAYAIGDLAATAVLERLQGGGVPGVGGGSAGDVRGRRLDVTSRTTNGRS
jgi:LacI family transcriptional regulator